MDAARPPGRPVRLLVFLLRFGVPAGIAVAGVVLIVLGHGRVHGSGWTQWGNTRAGAGVALIIAALIVWLMGWMFRMSVQSNRERDAEEEARRYFDRHGHWPDEES